MKLLPSLALAAALLAAGTAQAQTKVKTKDKYAGGTEIKTKDEVPPVTLDGPIKRVETLSGIDIFPKPNSNSVLLSFTQQFTKPGTLVMTDYKNKVVYQQELDPQHNTGAPVDLGHIQAGTYLVEAKTGNYVYWKKVRIKYPTVVQR
ncbi:T9SS type A sorting domain-containing protein [Hymenobacter sp. BRD67]|uniref:T9SS type A sorting domain-containing protein n=1 Tax=Hymenobacter sp. BRD67 TaxID=2675877 RepID=UPI001564E6CF|nr:T9SS type A sorting domain-containing protein [Hymenobacter sp. BRD67]QKG53280.1 T9SS type A sorting domain-containing protein [Hymenobacter sp. BRD67]